MHSSFFQFSILGLKWNVIPGERWHLFFRHLHLQTNSGRHSPSYPLCAKGSFYLNKQSESEAVHLLLSTANICSKILGAFLPTLHWDHFASNSVRDYVPSDSRANAPSVRAASIVKQRKSWLHTECWKKYNSFIVTLARLGFPFIEKLQYKIFLHQLKLNPLLQELKFYHRHHNIRNGARSRSSSIQLTSS